MLLKIPCSIDRTINSICKGSKQEHEAGFLCPLLFKTMLIEVQGSKQALYELTLNTVFFRPFIVHAMHIAYTFSSAPH